MYHLLKFVLSIKPACLIFGILLYLGGSQLLQQSVYITMIHPLTGLKVRRLTINSDES